MTVWFVAANSPGGRRVRSEWPAAALRELGWPAVVSDEVPRPRRLSEVDLVVLHQPRRPELVTSLKEHGAKVAVQIDDDLAALPEALTADVDTAAMVAAVRAADGLIVSTDTLAAQLRAVNPVVHVCRNYLPEWVSKLDRPREAGPVRIGWAGHFESHRHDLEWLRPAARAMTQGAVLVTVGDRRIAGLLGMTAWSRGWVRDVELFYRVMARADIGIVPLDNGEHRRFNAGRSWLKALEYLSLGRPVVATDFPEQRALLEGTGAGILVSSAEEMAAAVQGLVRDDRARTRMARAGLELARSITIERRIGEWTGALEAIGGSAIKARARTFRLSRPTGPPKRFAVLTPTRGLVHSRTIEAVLATVEEAERAGFGKRVDGQWWFFAHGLAIPEAHEVVTEQAMASGAEVLFFVEDDNLPPKEALSAAISEQARTGAGVMAVEYPIGVEGTCWASIYREHGEILFTALGITLVDRGVFEALRRPWFRVDMRHGRVPDGRGGTTLGLIHKPMPEGKGGVDVVFGLRVREETPFELGEVPGMVGGHIRIREMGGSSGDGRNRSPHVVEIRDWIDSEQTLFEGSDRTRFRQRPREGAGIR